MGVARGELRKLVEALGLGEAVGQVQRALEPQLRRHVREQVVDRGGADRFEHRGAVGVGCGGVAAHLSGQGSERVRRAGGAP